MATEGLTDAADALYALVPDEFTAARNARAAGAKPADPALARRIAALRRPSPAAWIVNRLARDHADRLGDLVGLGGELAEAQASADGRAMTALAAERREVVRDLLRAAVALADAADRSASRPVLDEVEQTLVAATVSADAGAAVRSGRLVRALQAVGFDVELDGAVAGDASAVPPARTARRGGPEAEQGLGRGTEAAAAEPEPAPEQAQTQERERRAAHGRAEAAVRSAREHAERARRALDEATARLEAESRRVDELRTERDELERRLDELRDELADAERSARSARRDHDSAADAADRAEVDIEEAEAELGHLG
ncbi:hypothetical protein ACFPER_14050 [Agromyces aurantiacus]|uniref:Transposase n=1 Tax=Agromyces aurantiacus TaxID=165814 RepID=A0ABV9R9D7_9MICO|nr:hypothetical protein [Agromyces aurantiacus]MBM7505183.1 chromosome segregation ATPase [Agromyces aurantiacus]